MLRAAVVVSLAALLCVTVPGGARGVEVAAAGGLVLAALVALGRRGVSMVGWIAIDAVVLNLAGIPIRATGNFNTPPSQPYRFDAVFAELRARLGDQGRVFLIPRYSLSKSFVFMEKTASLMRVRHIHDYEGLPELRVAEYFAVMRKWSGLENSTEAYMAAPTMPPHFRRRLLDLASVQYVITTPDFSQVDSVLALPRLSVGGDELRVYRNDGAFPGARYVARVDVVEDSDALLARLADGEDDLGSVALLEAPPESGFRGDVEGRGEARFLVDDSEHIVIEVRAAARGFLLLSDQHYPGWVARVNDVEVPILRADYLFRLVEVPAGTSRVEMRYRPASVRIGAAISLTTLLLLALFLWRNGHDAKTSWLSRIS